MNSANPPHPEPTPSLYPCPASATLPDRRSHPDLVAELSHELRTPLTAIQGALDLLHSGKLGTLTAQGQRMVKIAADNAARLMRLTAAIEGERKPTPLLSAEELANLRLETDLQCALERQEFQLNYQPIVSLETAQILGFEVLLRWLHPVLGLIPPDQFIPLAETTGLITEIGVWVLQEACSQMQRWRKQFPEQFAHLTISVNLANQQLLWPNLVEQIEQILETTGLPAQNLKLEITETGAMKNTDQATQLLETLRELGVQVYIDDFGTGYSSLHRLYELPLDVLKIDRSFVQQIDSVRGESMVRAIANLAESLGFDIIAEGIETNEQRLKLQALGCDKGQGFLFAKPLSRESVTDFICS